MKRGLRIWYFYYSENHLNSEIVIARRKTLTISENLCYEAIFPMTTFRFRRLLRYYH